MWGIKLGVYNTVKDTRDQLIHMQLFLVVIILMVTYSIVVSLPTKTLAYHDRLLLICKHVYLCGKIPGGVIYLLSGVYCPNSIYEIFLICIFRERISLINSRVVLTSYLYAILNKVVVAVHKCERTNDNRWCDYFYLLCFYEKCELGYVKGGEVKPLESLIYLSIWGGGEAA